jgi:hypothetical protein
MKRNAVAVAVMMRRKCVVPVVARNQPANAGRRNLINVATVAAKSQNANVNAEESVGQEGQEDQWA